jgi:hypothetical protein
MSRLADMSVVLAHQSLFIVMVFLAGTSQGLRLQTRAVSTFLECRTKLMTSVSGSVQCALVLACTPKGTKGAALKGGKLQERINDKSLAEIARFFAEAQRRADATTRAGQ